MAARNFGQKVEKLEVGPGQYAVTDSRYQLPKAGKKEAEAVWVKRVQNAGKIIKESRASGSTIFGTVRTK